MPDAKIVAPTPASSWRDLYPPHACADVFPMISDAELEALAQDIEQNGLRTPVVLWPVRDQWQVLDGRNRLAALQHLGITLPRTVNESLSGNYISLAGGEWQLFTIPPPGSLEPAAFVISANIRRRHLTKQEQAELIVKTFEAGQATNDRAKPARSFSPTSGKKGGSTKDPILAKAVTEAKKHGISKRTVQNARAKVQGKTTTRTEDGTRAKHRPRTTAQEAAEALAQAARARRELEDLQNVIANAKLTGAERAAQRALALRVIDIGYKAVARELHPDVGGIVEAMARLNVVRDRLKRCIA